MLIGDQITVFLFLVLSVAWKEAGKRLEMQGIAVVPLRLWSPVTLGEGHYDLQVWVLARDGGLRPSLETCVCE